MIKLIVSRSQELNSEYIKDLVRQLNDLSKRVYLVVPQQFTLNTDVRLLDILEEDAILNIKVKSFTTLIREVLTYSGGIKRQNISKSGKLINMKLALKNIEDKLIKYRGNVNDSGFVEILLKQIDEFKDSGISSEDLLEIGREEGGELEKKLMDISLIYEEYNKLISSSYVDTQDRMTMMNDQ